MTDNDQLRAELRTLRRDLRELTLLTRGLCRVLVGDRAETAVHDIRFLKEHHVYRYLRVETINALERQLGKDPSNCVTTLEDLTFNTRDEVAGIKGVGPKSMARLDAAMAEHGLRFEEAG